MRIGLAVVAALLVALLPVLVLAGAPTLRGLGWMLVVGGAVLLLVDLTDRLVEWVERRRWGRRP
jgi:hypothetical protein